MRVINSSSEGDVFLVWTILLLVSVVASLLQCVSLWTLSLRKLKSAVNCRKVKPVKNFIFFFFVIVLCGVKRRVLYVPQVVLAVCHESAQLVDLHDNSCCFHTDFMLLSYWLHTATILQLGLWLGSMGSASRSQGIPNWRQFCTISCLGAARGVYIKKDCWCFISNSYKNDGQSFQLSATQTVLKYIVTMV